MRLIDADRLEYKLGILLSQSEIPDIVWHLIIKEIKEAPDERLRHYAEGYKQGRFDEAMDREIIKGRTDEN